MTLKQISERINLTEQMVRQIVSAHGVKPARHGEWDAVECLAATTKHYRAMAEESRGADYTKERALLTKVRRQTAELELEQMRGKYVLLSDVEETFEMVSRENQSILQRKLSELPHRLLGRGVVEMTDMIEAVADEVVDAHQLPYGHNTKPGS